MTLLETAREWLDDKVRIHESYQVVFSTPDGQRVLSHILRHGHVFDCTFVRGDSHETALREGERRLALSILRRVCKRHEDFQKLAETYYDRTTNTVT